MLILPLRIVRYSDTKAVLNAYSRENGRIAFIIPDGKGKGAIRNRSVYQPLTPLEAQVDARPGQEFHRIYEPQPIEPLFGIYSNPLKQTIVMFLAEALTSILKHPLPDPLIFDFISQSIITLDKLPTNKSANFHIIFLWRLSQLLGIAPDTGAYVPGYIFDLNDAIFRPSFPLHRDYILPDFTPIIPLLDRLTYRSMSLLKISRQQRSDILDTIIRYYELHDIPLHPLRSLPVLRAIF